MKHIFYCFFVLLCLAGCESETSEPATPQSSPQALLDEVKSLLTQSPPDTMGFLALVHTENADQELILKMERLLREPTQIVGRAWMERFDVYSKSENPFPIWPVDDIALESADDMEAQALCADNPRSGFESANRSEYMLHLVRLEDRWWVSGYSFEARPENDIELIARSLANFESTFATNLERAKLYAEALRGGRFSNFEEAYDGWLDFARSGEWP